MWKKIFAIDLSCQKWTGKKWTLWSTFGRKKWTGGSTFFCQKWTCLAKSGPGPFCQEKSGPGPVLAGEKSGPGPVLPSKSKQVHFWQGKKVDPVQFPAEIQAGPFLAGEKSGPGQVSCRNPGRSIFGRGKKWTRSSFAVEIQAGPFLAGEKSGPGPVSLSKSRQVHFWQGKKVDPVQFRCRNPGRSIFGRGKKWTRSSFAVEIQAGPFLAGEKSGPGPVSLSKSRQVHFWQGKKVDPVQFRCRNPGRSIFGRGKKWTRSSFAVEIQAGPFLAGEKSGPGPVSLSKSRQVHFWQGKKVDPVQFRCRNPGRSIFGRGKKWTRSNFLPKSRQVHFWQGEKVDPVQFRCRNPGRSIFGRGKKWTRSSFAVEIQAGPFLARENSGPGPVLLLKFRQVQWTWL